jgi:Bacterial pre-peptidase C-terminal domain
VYSVKLLANQKLRFSTSSDGSVILTLWYPDTKSIDQSPRAHFADQVRTSDHDTDTYIDFFVPQDGVYYLSVSTQAAGITYSVYATYLGALPFHPRPESDVPGTSIDLNGYNSVTLPISGVESIVDGELKPRDVYSIKVTSGQTLKLTTSSYRAVSLAIYYPNTNSVDPASGATPASQAISKFGEAEASLRFTAATTGTYYAVIATALPGVIYRLAVSVE